MKSMTCNQLGGACDKVFQAETFEEMAGLSKQHGMEMFQKQDPDHLAAIQKVMAMSMDPEAMKKWMDDARLKFEALPED